MRLFTLMFYYVMHRLFFLPFKIVHSVVYESTYSHLDAAKDPTGDLYLFTMRVYASLISALCVLHYMWFWMMLQKSYRELFGGKGKQQEDSKQKKKQKAA